MKSIRPHLLQFVLCAIGIACGSAAVPGRGAEPLGPAVPSWQPPDLPGPRSAAALTAPQAGRLVLLLEEMPVGRPLIWNGQPLVELQRQLAAEADIERRRREAQQPKPNSWRAHYGDVAPLAIPPKQVGTSRHGGLDAFKAAIQRIEALRDQGRASPADFYLHGLIYYDSGGFRTALQDFDRAIRLAPRANEEHYCMRGLAEYGLKEYERAAADLDEAVRLSRNVRNLNNRGVIACARGLPRQALGDFDEALGIRQYVIRTWPVFMNRALAMTELGQHQQAMTDLNGLRAGQPDSRYPSLLASAWVYRRMGDHRKSGLIYDEAVQLKRADNLLANGQPTADDIAKMPGNRTFLDEFAGEEAGAEALLGRGIEHHELGQIYPAIDDYTKALRERPDLTAAFVNRALAYIACGKLDLAERDLEKALQIDPPDAFAFGNRGQLRIKQGRIADGEADLKRCLQLRPDLQAVLQPIRSTGQSPAGAEPPSPVVPQGPMHLRPSPFAPDPQRQSEPSKTAPVPAEPPSSAASPEAPSPRSPPSAALPAPAWVPYAAATPEAAVEWLAAKTKAGDDDAVIQCLAPPLGLALEMLRKYTLAWESAMKKYFAAKNARRGGFLNPADSPLEQMLKREREKGEKAQKSLLQEIKILKKETMPKTEDAVRLVLSMTWKNELGETRQSESVCIAFRLKGVWKLMPEAAVAAVGDEKQKQAFDSYVIKQGLCLRKMCDIANYCTKAMEDPEAADKLPLIEASMMAALSQILREMPSRDGDQPTLIAIMTKFSQDLGLALSGDKSRLADEGGSASGPDGGDARPKPKGAAKKSDASKPSEPSSPSGAERE